MTGKIRKKNDFAIADEVTVKGLHNKRPDIVLYVNGIALGVLELKRSTVSLSEGIRQNLDNQKHIFIKPFFSTVQYIMAGNDSEGIAYGAIETKEKYFMKWKEVSEELNKNDAYLLKITKPVREKSAKVDYVLDKNIIELLNKERFIELLHDFIVYDRGIKKLCRHNQYFAVKAAQQYVRKREGCIIWNTQGSGKSLIMVWLTKWIREHVENARVLIITDREELDEQIEKVFNGVSEKIYRTKSGKDLVNKLNNNAPWLLCSLVHKFGGKEEGDVDEYLKELKGGLPADFEAKGDIFVFVDECHRTQSGKSHDATKTLLPNAMFIGFTGTPLLKKDKKTSLEVFGKYIHTYKFDEAVSDKVVLDLRYEARDIEQKITSLEKIDEWFELKTRGLTDFAKIELKQKWGTLKKVEQFEEEVKAKFVNEPAQMKLLIVVGKLLTGFDAPPATYLYIDKEMKDHGLFQAICRVNRLDGDDKDYGYIVDYKDLFDSLKDTFKDYTSGAFDAYEKSDVEGLLKDRLEKGKERLDEALEAIKALCEPVEPPKDPLAHIRYFCGRNTENPDELKETEPRRVSLYKLTIALIRAYANVADEMKEAGYSEKETAQIKNDVRHFENLRKEIQLASGDYIDLKQYEPAMRHLIDSYIGAEESRVLSSFDDMSLIDLMVEKGKDAIKDLPNTIRGDKDAIAETIENNLRKLIIEESPTNPMYYEKMSVLLDELIRMRKEAAKEYEEYLREIIELTKKVRKPNTSTEYPDSINTGAKRALYDNLDKNEALANELDEKIQANKRDRWRDTKIKLKEVELVVRENLEHYGITEKSEIQRIFGLVKNQRDY